MITVATHPRFNQISRARLVSEMARVIGPFRPPTEYPRPPLLGMVCVSCLSDARDADLILWYRVAWLLRHCTLVEVVYASPCIFKPVPLGRALQEERRTPCPAPSSRKGGYARGHRPAGLQGRRQSRSHICQVTCLTCGRPPNEHLSACCRKNLREGN